VAAVRPALMGTAAHVLRRGASTTMNLAGGRRVPPAAGRASSIRQHSLLYLLVRGEQRRFYTVFCDLSPARLPQVPAVDGDTSASAAAGGGPLKCT
jgi:hypothetical protein